MKKLYTLLLLCLLHSQSANAEQNEDVVKSFINAFNENDVDAMLCLADHDMKWMSVSGHQISMQTSSASELREAMLGYFKSMPSARSELRDIRESGPFVNTVEEAFWLSNGIEKSQCSLAVYELQDSKIKNVWYFPEHRC